MKREPIRFKPCNCSIIAKAVLVRDRTIKAKIGFMLAQSHNNMSEANKETLRDILRILK